MNIRKHWKKVLLSSTAFFWASCGGDSESVSAAGGTTNEAPVTLIPDSNSTIDDGGMVALYGVQAIVDLDSGAVSSADACDGDCTVPASSDDAASSASESAESSSSQSADKKLRLANDTTITCVHTLDNDGGRCLDAEDHQKSVNAIKKQLAENQTLTLEQLRELEDENEDPSMDMEVCLYGVPSMSCTHVSSASPIYKCSDEKVYSYNTLYTLQHDDDPDTSGLIEGEDRLLYTTKEYKEKYPEKFLSSSSEEPSSSNSAPPPSPDPGRPTASGPARSRGRRPHPGRRGAFPNASAPGAGACPGGSPPQRRGCPPPGPPVGAYKRCGRPGRKAPRPGRPGPCAR